MRRSLDSLRLLGMTSLAGQCYKLQFDKYDFIMDVFYHRIRHSSPSKFHPQRKFLRKKPRLISEPWQLFLCSGDEGNDLQVQDLAGFLHLGKGGGGDLHQGLVHVLGGAGLGVSPQGIHGVLVVLSLTGGKSSLVQGVDGQGVVGLLAHHGTESGVDDADDGLIIPLVGLGQDHLGHFLLDGHALLGLVVSGTGGGVVAESQVADSGACADDHQDGQGDDLLLGDGHIGLGGEDQLCTAGHGDQDLQEQGDDHGLNGEHGQVLEDTGGGHDAHDGFLGAVGVADVGIVPCVDDLLQHHVDEEADAEAGQHDADGSDLSAVQEQGVEHGACDLRQHEGQEVVAGGPDHEADGIGDHGGGDGNHRSEDHRAQGGGQGSGLDVQLGAQGDGRGLQGDTQCDQQCGDHQHLDVLQLTGGVAPVSQGEGGLVQGSGSLTS